MGRDLGGTTPAAAHSFTRSRGFAHVAHADALAPVTQGDLVAAFHQHGDAEQLKKLLQFENISESLLEEVDHSEKSSFLFVNVYYCDYPAYQNKWMLVKIQNNVWGIQFCETSENSKMLGENNALRITSSEINEYLNHLV